MNIEKERENFENWLFLFQTEVDADDLNKNQIDIAMLAWMARAWLGTKSDGQPCRIIEADLSTGIFTLQMSDPDFSVSAGPKYLCDVPMEGM